MRQGLPSPPRPMRRLAHGHRVSSERRHFCRLSLNVRPMAIASPTLFICVVSVGSACGMVAVRQHLEGKARDLGDDVINARLEARGGFARDVVLEFVEQVAVACQRPTASLAEEMPFAQCRRQGYALTQDENGRSNH